MLRVASAHGAMLLTGDIEKSAEGLLVGRDGAPSLGQLRSEVMIAPHHGSRTSSTPAFLSAVRPAVVVVPVGYRNRFGHPRADVVARYTAAGAKVLRTDLDGAILVRLAEGAADTSVERVAQPRYWRDRRL